MSVGLDVFQECIEGDVQSLISSAGCSLALLRKWTTTDAEKPI